MKTGLRTEIVVSIVLLLGAALLFAGFLLVKLTERELLAERRLALQRLARVAAAATPAAPELAARLLPLTRDGELVAWRLLGAGRVPLMAYAAAGTQPPDDLLPADPAPEEVVERLRYASSWNPFGAVPPGYLDLAIRSGDRGPVLQLRFSLASLVEQVQGAQRLVLLYVVLYGAVLSVFGISLLNRNVVEPVRRLRRATAGVAAGELTPIVVPRGPGEIAELAEDFNRMVAALQASRAETGAHIRSLEEANTALQQARDEVVRVEKLASVGHLAAGMAHEIGNPLAAVIGYLNLLQADLADPAARDLVERSLAGAGRIDRLVRDLLDYAAPARIAEERFDPAAVLREAVALLSGQGALDGVVCVDRLPPDCGKVRMDPGRFLQVCVNLLLNARDALPGGGTVTLSARRAGGRLLLTVADDGAGMAPETLRRLFEPFFTTKDPGKGRGLGLAVCQRIIADAGGTIEAASAPGKGSAFTVHLPLEDAEG